jgi:hypothetical protein
MLILVRNKLMNHILIFYEELILSYKKLLLQKCTLIGAINRNNQFAFYKIYSVLVHMNRYFTKAVISVKNLKFSMKLSHDLTSTVFT